MPPRGFEPLTCALGKRCSILLSYEGKYFYNQDLKSLLDFLIPKRCSVGCSFGRQNGEVTGSNGWNVPTCRTHGQAKATRTV